MRLAGLDLVTHSCECHVHPHDPADHPAMLSAMSSLILSSFIVCGTMPFKQFTWGHGTDHNHM